MCEFVCQRERVCECVSERGSERERGREKACVYIQREREREREGGKACKTTDIAGARSERNRQKKTIKKRKKLHQGGG